MCWFGLLVEGCVKATEGRRLIPDVVADGARYAAIAPDHRGDERVIRQRIQEHFDAGASHVCLQAMDPDGQPLPDLNALAGLAP
jgi:hypothetical protein